MHSFGRSLEKCGNFQISLVLLTKLLLLVQGETDMETCFTLPLVLSQHSWLNVACVVKSHFNDDFKDTKEMGYS